MTTAQLSASIFINPDYSLEIKEELVMLHSLCQLYYLCAFNLASSLLLKNTTLTTVLCLFYNLFLSTGSFPADNNLLEDLLDQHINVLKCFSFKKYF